MRIVAKEVAERFKLQKIKIIIAQNQQLHKSEGVVLNSFATIYKRILY